MCLILRLGLLELRMGKYRGCGLPRLLNLIRLLNRGLLVLLKGNLLALRLFMNELVLGLP